MLVEMRDRLAPANGAAADAMVLHADAAPEAEAFAALVGLGYRPAEATRLLKAAGPGTHSTEELIRRALQSAAKE
jgi:Holliday junction DNA helicase RuvA